MSCGCGGSSFMRRVKLLGLGGKDTISGTQLAAGGRSEVTGCETLVDFGTVVIQTVGP